MGAISVSSDVQRLPAHGHREVIDRVVAAARAVSERLGYTGRSGGDVQPLTPDELDRLADAGAGRTGR